MITYLPWYVEMWIAFTVMTLLLMTVIFWMEVRAGRYDPTLWDVEGDDGEGREDSLPVPPNGQPSSSLSSQVRKRSVYDLIEEEDR